MRDPVHNEPPTISVILPVLNTWDTLAPLVRQFSAHPAIDEIFVSVDGANDSPLLGTSLMDCTVIWPDVRGKGQVVKAALNLVTSDYVIFCDSDITGVTQEHIDLITADAMCWARTMTIAVPNVPRNFPMDRLWAWRWVSGQRCIERRLVQPLELHGYLMEVQLNSLAKHSLIPIRFEWWRGCHSEYNMNPKRIQRMEEDAKWGAEHGLFPRTPRR